MIYRPSPVLTVVPTVVLTALLPIFFFMLFTPSVTRGDEAPALSPCLEQVPEPGDATPYHHEPTGLVFPATIGSFSYEGIRTYQNEEAGLSVEYKDGRAGLSIYLYKNNYRDIPDGPLSEPVLREFSGAVQALSRIESWQRAEDQEEQNGIASVQVECGTIEYQHAVFRAVSSRNIEYLSYVVVTGALGHIVKIRMSLPVLEDPETTQAAYSTSLGTMTGLILQASIESD